MRILVVHQYYLAPGQAGGSRFNEFAARWAAAGHDVEIVAGTIDYSTAAPMRDRPWWVGHRDEDGIGVWRCRVPVSYNRGYVGRAWAFVGFAASATTAVVLASKADVVISTSPPLITAITGLIGSWRHRAPWVFEVRDLWPESAITTGVIGERSLLARVLYGLERLACRHASMVNVLTPAFREDLLKRGLVEEERICFVPNGADVDVFTPGPRENGTRSSLGWGDKVVALYAGAHGRANALGQLVDAAAYLRDRPDILIVSVGDGPERQALERTASERGLSNIGFVGARAKEDIPAMVQACDIGLAVLQDNPTFRTVYPNKVFDYMSAERPTVIAIDGVARELVEGADAGVFARPEDGKSLADAIRRLADQPEERRRLGSNGRAWVLANASRSSLATKYLSILTDLVKR